MSEEIKADKVLDLKECPVRCRGKGQQGNQGNPGGTGFGGSNHRSGRTG